MSQTQDDQISNRDQVGTNPGIRGVLLVSRSQPPIEERVNQVHEQAKDHSHAKAKYMYAFI